MAGKQDDYGYFGKGIDGYVHYKQAFDRNFSGNEQVSHRSTVGHSTTTSSGPKQHKTQKPVADVSKGKEPSIQLDNTVMNSDSFYYPPEPTPYSTNSNDDSIDHSKKDVELDESWGNIKFFVLIFVVTGIVFGIPYFIFTVLSLMMPMLPAVVVMVGIIYLIYFFLH